MGTLYLIEGSTVQGGVKSSGAGDQGRRVERAEIVAIAAHKKMEGAAVARAPSIQSVGLQND